MPNVELANDRAQPCPAMEHTNAIAQLAHWVSQHPRLLVITGAGLSTASSIPDYRDRNGQWKRKPPVTFQDFMRTEAVRKRYWGRSLVGWQFFSRAKPNAAHHALVSLEHKGLIELVVTQNVDDLHQQAGQQRLLPLHGTIDKVRCMVCGDFELRDPFQQRLQQLNPAFAQLRGTIAPDGDADLEAVDFSPFNIPTCLSCNGLLKPDAVFYGESVPRERHQQADEALTKANAVLVTGSSMMVYSSYRLALKARELNKPIAAINLGKTRADELLDFKLEMAAEVLLPELKRFF